MPVRQKPFHFANFYGKKTFDREEINIRINIKRHFQKNKSCVNKDIKGVSGRCYYSRFLAKALPEEVLRYLSKSRAFCLSVKAIVDLIFQGVHFEVCLHFP